MAIGPIELVRYMAEILDELGLPNLDALYIGLGEGELTVAQVAGAVHRRLKEQEPQRPRAFKPAAASSPGGMVIDGVGDLLSTFARCCRPVPPEAIAGYITLGRGVSIHRADCANLLRMRDLQPRRVLAVDWGRPSPERTFPAAIVIHAFDRKGLTRDVTSVLADEQISISAMNVATNPAENTAQIDITVTVHGLDELSRLLSRFGSLPNVISARRRH